MLGLKYSQLTKRDQFGYTWELVVLVLNAQTS